MAVWAWGLWRLPKGTLSSTSFNRDWKKQWLIKESCFNFKKKATVYTLWRLLAVRRTKCGLKLCQSAVTSFNGHVSKSTAIWGDESQGETLLFPTFISEVAGRKALDPPLLPECTSRCIKYDPTSKTTKLTNLWKSIVDYLSACAHVLSPATLLLLIFHDLWSAFDCKPATVVPL